MSEGNGSLLAELATQAAQYQYTEQTHIVPIPLTYTEAKLYAFAQAEHWRQLTIADVNDMYYDNPYVNLWIEDDTVQIALSVTRPNIKRYVRLVKKEVDSQ
jgi:predicted amidophosphoribosyltransferase